MEAVDGVGGATIILGVGFPGVIVQISCPRWNFLKGNFPGVSYTMWELSGGKLSYVEIIQGQLS